MRNKPIRSARFIALFLVAMSLLLVHPSSPLMAGASAAQDPNATLPPPKPKPAPKKSVPPARTTRRSPPRTNGGNSGTSNAAADEIAFWNSIKDSRDPEDFRAYLEQYPNGKFVTLAKNRLKSLGAAQPNSATTSTTPATRTTSAPQAGTVVRNQMGMELVLIPGGTFMMGSENGGAYEKPQHQVTISQPFYLGKYEVTQAQWQQVMGNNPANFKGDNLPVENVSWLDAQNFIQKLNAMNDGFIYRLPSEAEWEYACRAGTTGDYAGNLDTMAWYGNNSGRQYLDAAEIARTDSANYYKRVVQDNGAQTHPVGTKQANSWGLYDMHGNVWEWCEDWYHDNYNGAPSDGSAWESSGEQKYRVLRGGSWYDGAGSLRSARRVRNSPDVRDFNDGFRVVAFART